MAGEPPIGETEGHRLPASLGTAWIQRTQIGEVDRVLQRWIRGRRGQRLEIVVDTRVVDRPVGGRQADRVLGSERLGGQSQEVSARGVTGHGEHRGEGTARRAPRVANVCRGVIIARERPARQALRAARQRRGARVLCRLGHGGLDADQLGGLAPLRERGEQPAAAPTR